MAAREGAFTARRLARRSVSNGRRVVRIPMAWTAERTILAAIVGLSTLVRAAASLHRSTPALYPDEYVYAELSRGIAATGLPRIRGAFTNFHALVVPYLVSPAAFIHDAATSYHAALLEGSLAFSLAAVPAFMLARRVGVSSGGALLVALVTVMVPDGAYTTMLLTEPYAYPLFIAACLLALETLVAPSRGRQVALLAAFALLVGVRMQFVFVPLAYVVAALFAVGGPLRTRVRRQAIIFAGVALAAVLVGVAGSGRAAGYYSPGLVARDPVAVARWGGVELFILLIASGWVIVPAAAAGCVWALRGRVERFRALVVFALAALVGLVGEAAYVDAGDGISHERYVFYAVPLLAVIAAVFIGSRETTRLYRVAAYTCVGLAIIVPSTSIAHDAMNAQAPTLVGLRALVGASSRLSILWALALALAMGLVALRLLPIRRTLIVTLAIQAAVACAASVDLLNPASLGVTRFQPDHSVVLGSPNDVLLDAPPGAALITSSLNNNFVLMKVLFWNPNVSRVLVIGGTTAVDGFRGTEISVTSRRGLTDSRGQLVPGPFAVDQETTAIESPGDAPQSVLRRPPGVLFVGLNSADRYLASAATLYLRSGARPDSVTMDLVSTSGRKTIGVSCPGALWRVAVGREPVRVTVPGTANSVRQCRLSLIRGIADVYDARIVSVQVRNLAYIAGRPGR